MITKENVSYEVGKMTMWIREQLKKTKTSGIVVGNSGGKDSAVVIALCKRATDRVLGVILPCGNITQDELHAEALATEFNVSTVKIDLKDTFDVLLKTINNISEKTSAINKIEGLAMSNIKPRLRMTTLYSIAQSKGYLVAGTGNKSERTMGYFTKWGDGGCDFNPIGNLTVQEILILGEYLGVPTQILYKAPSAGLWEGQTDEQEMGVTYKEIDEYLITGKTNERATEIIENNYNRTNHKRELPPIYGQ
ncbi:MAG: synthetase [Clostridiaceae bacterium]|jgi:NAD+ synthase|nr:synthetase [Clostridiaceae bacterium]